MEFMLTMKGIEVNPNKCQAIIKSRNPFSVNKVQQLTGHLVVLTCFLSCAGNKAFHLFATLKKKDKFQWIRLYDEDLYSLKVFLKIPQLLTCQKAGTPLYLYKYVSNRTMRFVLV